MKIMGRVRHERDNREDEWLRIARLEEAVAQIEREMRAIRTYVNQQPHLGRRRPA